MTDKTIGVKTMRQARETDIWVTADVPVSAIARNAIKNDSRLHSKLIRCYRFGVTKVLHLQSRNPCGSAYTTAMSCALRRVSRGC